jgi:DNA-binding MarR family transcriptional regulator
MSNTSTFTVVKALSTGIHRDFPITLALIYARVVDAGPEGILQSQVGRELGLSRAALTRNVQTLGKLHFGKLRQGLGLVQPTSDPTDSRQRILRLTDRGEALSKALNAVGRK